MSSHLFPATILGQNQNRKWSPSYHGLSIDWFLWLAEYLICVISFYYNCFLVQTINDVVLPSWSLKNCVSIAIIYKYDYRFLFVCEFFITKGHNCCQNIITSLELCLKPASSLSTVMLLQTIFILSITMVVFSCSWQKNTLLDLNEVLRQQLLIQIYASLTLHLSPIRFQ